MTYKKLVFKDNCIDFIRLIAAMIVMFSHSFRWFGVDKPIWGLYFTDGSVGVITFNVLSGFLIFSSWERFSNSETCIKKRIKKYAISRIFRIYLHIAKLNGRVCGAKRPHSVFEQSICYLPV